MIFFFFTRIYIDLFWFHRINKIPVPIPSTVRYVSESALALTTNEYATCRPLKSSVLHFSEHDAF